MKDGVEVDPGNISVVVLLHRQNLGNKMIPIEEPLAAEDIQNLKDRRPVMG